MALQEIQVVDLDEDNQVAFDCFSDGGDFVLDAELLCNIFTGNTVLTDPQLFIDL